VVAVVVVPVETVHSARRYKDAGSRRRWGGSRSGQSGSSRGETGDGGAKWRLLWLGLEMRDSLLRVEG
jgi:hypothetical protein